MDWGSVAAALGGAALGAIGGNDSKKKTKVNQRETAASQTASETSSTAETTGTSDKQSTSRTSGATTSGPLSWQTPYLQEALATAQQLYGNAAAQGAYTGDLYADLTPEQAQALQGIQTYVQGQGGQLTDATVQAAKQAIQSGQGAAQALNGIAAQAGVGEIASDADLFANSNLGRQVQAAGAASGFGNVMDQARAYADANAPALVQSAVRDDVRAVTEGALPQLERSAALTGNTNSSRTAIAEGIARRGLEDRVADVSAQVRQGLMDQGVSTGLQSANQQAGIFSNLLGQGTSAGLSGRQIQLGASGQQADLFGQGVAAGATGNQMALGNQNTALTAGGVLQADEQAQLDALRQAFYERRDTPMALFGQYWPIISKSLGQTTTTDMNQTGSSTGTTTENATANQSQTGVSSGVSEVKSNTGTSRGSSLIGNMIGGAASGLGLWNKL